MQAHLSVCFWAKASLSNSFKLVFLSKVKTGLSVPLNLTLLIKLKKLKLIGHYKVNQNSKSKINKIKLLY